MSTYFCICPFQLPNWFYCIRRELVNETPITNCYPSTFCARSWSIIRCAYIAKAMWPLHVHYYFVSVYYLYRFVVVAFYSFLLVASSSKRHLSTLVLNLKLILLSLGCFFLIWSASRIFNFCLWFCCSNIVVFFGKNFPNSVFRPEWFFRWCSIELVSDKCIVSRLDRVVEVKPMHILLF